MTSDELFDAFREDAEDTVAPYLWSDDEIYRYMDDAYYQFVRLTGGISDFTSDATVVGASAGEQFSDLHPSVLTIRKAYRADGRELDRVNAEDPPVPGESDYGNLPSLLMDLSTGPLRAVVVGLEDDVVRWIPVPAADEEVKLLIYRLPLTHITDDGQQFAGVKDMHHLHLLDWMKSRAYRKQDTETYDKDAAEECEARFRQYCSQVRAEWERKKHKPRLIAYGGI